MQMQQTISDNVDMLANKAAVPLIEVKDLYCIYGEHYTLIDINWEVRAGENWVVFGLNGSGKTTLLSIIAGYLSANSGTIRVFGQEYSVENTLDLRKRIGWVSSSFFDRYYYNETAINIVLSGLFGTLGVSGMVSDEDIIRAKKLLKELNLYRKENRIFGTMSKGERQNVLIARALISNPDILVLDEPGNGLDVLAREYMLETVQKLSKEKNITVLYVTHYIEEILPIFENALILKEGKIYDIGKTEGILNTENLSEYFCHNIQITHQNDRYTAALKTESKIIELL